MNETNGQPALSPGQTIGILGGGQLGRMLALAAAPMGLKAHIYCPEPNSPAFDVSGAYTLAAYDDEGALEAFADAVDVITYEFENVPAATAALLDHIKPVRPGKMALEVAQDRLTEKAFLSECGFQVARHWSVDSLVDLEAAFDRCGGPGLLKTRRLGYDGKGQAVVRHMSDLAAAWEAVAGAPCILEAFVDFDCEVSIIAARDVSGRTDCYDLVRNTHANQILDTSDVPAGIATVAAAQAKRLAAQLLERLDYIGVLTIEFFVKGDTLIANEIAPRVHNSGHWTIEACLVSQFAQHMRAVAGWPLGSTGRHHDATMTNLIGEDVGRWEELAREPETAVHLYGKADTRPGRKMGHATRLRPKAGN